MVGDTVGDLLTMVGDTHITAGDTAGDILIMVADIIMVQEVWPWQEEEVQTIWGIVVETD